MVFDFDENTRPIWIYNIYIAAFLWISLRGLLYVHANKVYRDQSRQRVFLFIAFFSIFAVFYCINSDYFRYRTFVQYVADGTIFYSQAEEIYFQIAELVQGNFELYRFVIWGGAIILTAWSCKLLKVPVYMSLLIWFILYFDKVCYARASLAMAMLLTGAALIIKGERKSHILLFGVFVALISVFFHRSIIIGLAGIPVLFMKFSRKHIYIYGAFMIVACLFFISFINTFPDLLTEEYTDKLDTYNSEIASGRWERHTFKNYLSSSLNYGLFYVPLVVTFFKIRDNRNKISNQSIRLFGLTITIAIIATAFWFYYGFNNAFFYRVLYMTAAPISIATASLYKDRVVSKQYIEFLIIYSVVYHLLYLYTIIQTQNIH